MSANQSLPLGARPVTTVPLFNLWTYRHTGHFLAGEVSSYWSPAIFAPREGMLAMSDPQPISGVVFAGLQVVLPPVGAYNMLATIILTLNGIAAGWLAAMLGCRRVAILASVLCCVWLPFVAAEIGVLQLAVISPTIWTLGLMLRFHHESHPRDAVLIGVGVAVSYLTSGYWGLWLAFACIVAGAALVRRSHLRRGPILGIVAAIGVVVISCGPFVYFQQKYVGQYHWDGDYIDSLAANAIDYVRVGKESLAAQAPWTIDTDDWPIRLYPGILLFGAAVLGTFVLLKETLVEDSPISRRSLFVCLFFIQATIVLSFGQIELLGDWSPMNLLQRTVPGLEKLRSPYRLGMFVSVLMLPLAAIGIDRMTSWSPKSAAVLVGLGVLEVAPISGFHAGRTDIAAAIEMPPAWCDLLEENCVVNLSKHADLDGNSTSSTTDVLIHLPMGGSEPGYESICRAMLLQPTHGVPLTGGYSGFFPPEVKRLEALTAKFPDGPSSLALLQAGVTTIVIDRGKMTELQLANLDRLPKLLQKIDLDEQADVAVYRFTDAAIDSVKP